MSKKIRFLSAKQTVESCDVLRRFEKEFAVKRMSNVEAAKFISEKIGSDVSPRSIPSLCAAAGVNWERRAAIPPAPKSLTIPEDRILLTREQVKSIVTLLGFVVKEVVPDGNRLLSKHTSLVELANSLGIVFFIDHPQT